MTGYRRAVAWLGILGVVLTTATTAWADWRESYRAGVEAFAARRWAEVVRDMNAALADRSEEKAGSSAFVRRYTPRYYLAAAMAEQGDCRGALPVFEEAASLGQIQRTDDHEDFKRRLRACEALLSQASNASASAGTAVEKAEKAGADAARLSGDPILAPLWEEGDPSLAALYDQADRLLRQARQRLGEGRRTDELADLDATQTLAGQALRAFEDLQAEARTKRNAVNTATESALESLEEEATRGRRALRGVSDLAPYPRTLGRGVAAVEAALETIDQEKATASQDELQALADDLDQALDRLGAVARRPPKALLDAGEAYLAGDMTATLEHLATLNSKQSKVQTQRCLLGAAAAFTLAELAGPDDTDAAARLDESVAICADLKTAPEPDDTFFSPRLIEFLRVTLATSSNEAPDS